MKRILLIAVLAALVLALLPSAALASGPTLGSLWKVNALSVKVYDGRSYSADSTQVWHGAVVKVINVSPSGWVRVSIRSCWNLGPFSRSSVISGWVPLREFETSLTPFGVYFA